MPSHVVIEKSGKGSGYFLIIADHILENTWAVTEGELKLLKEKLVEMFPVDCICACHENKLNKPYLHDIKCCEAINGSVQREAVDILTED